MIPVRRENRWFYSAKTRTWHVKRLESYRSLCGHVQALPPQALFFDPQDEPKGTLCRVCTRALEKANVA